MCHIGFVVFRFLNQHVLLQQVEGLKEVQVLYISFVTFITHLSLAISLVKGNKSV